MQAIILAAGRGVRMQPLTENTPKPLLLVNGRSILEYSFEALPDMIDEVLIVEQYLENQIRNFTGEEFYGRKIIHIHQNEINGSGGAVHACRERITGKFLVINGDDIYSKKDLENLVKEKYAILASEVQGPVRFGAFEIDHSGRLVRIVEGTEKREKIKVNAGAYVLDDKFFDYPLIPISDEEYGLPQTLATMTKDVAIKIIPATQWIPIGFPEDISKAEQRLAENKILN